MVCIALFVLYFVRETMHEGVNVKKPKNEESEDCKRLKLTENYVLKTKN